MTVFGFGRDHNEMSLTDRQSPNTFTFGLIDPSDASVAGAMIRGAYRPVRVTAGAAQRRP